MTEAATSNTTSVDITALGSEEKIKRINALIALKKEADMQALKIEGHLKDVDVEYQREVSGMSASIIRGLDGYLGIRSASGTPLNNSRTRRPSALGGVLRDEDRIFTRAALLSSTKHSQNRNEQHHYAMTTSTASSGEEDFERDPEDGEEKEEDTIDSEDDSDYEGGGGSSSRRRQR